MSLITSCPACGTMFRVVPDQLRISEGWVRCGHCAEIFDATAHLASHAAPSTDPDESFTEPTDLPTQPPDWDALPPEEFTPPTPATLAQQHARRAMSEPPRRAAWVEEPEAPQQPSPQPAPAPSAREGRPSALPRETRPPPQQPLDETDLEQVSFVRQARRAAYWRRPGVRLGLAFLSLLLASALMLQAAYHDHDRLAALHPPLKPWLQRMCDYLECRIEPPRQIEAIVIENSGFSRLRGDQYRLTFTLRNTLATEVAAPAIELTLTDTQDQPVVRRVLTPAELGAASPVIAGASDWSGALGLNVSTNGGAGRVAGYRLLAFYP
jgi:predicted Zn finger-like uncharacterized protein